MICKTAMSSFYREKYTEEIIEQDYFNTIMEI
jgi:hypothetical protein